MCGSAAGLPPAPGALERPAWAEPEIGCKKNTRRGLRLLFVRGWGRWQLSRDPHPGSPALGHQGSPVPALSGVGGSIIPPPQEKLGFLSSSCVRFMWLQDFLGLLSCAANPPPRAASKAAGGAGGRNIPSERGWEKTQPLSGLLFQARPYPLCLGWRKPGEAATVPDLPVRGHRNKAPGITRSHNVPAGSAFPSPGSASPSGSPGQTPARGFAHGSLCL